MNDDLLVFIVLVNLRWNILYTSSYTLKVLFNALAVDFRNCLRRYLEVGLGVDVGIRRDLALTYPTLVV